MPGIYLAGRPGSISDRAGRFERGAEFAGRMFALYDYMIRQLNEANLQKEVRPIQIVEELLDEIRVAWAKMLGQSDSVAA